MYTWGRTKMTSDPSVSRHLWTTGSYLKIVFTATSTERNIYIIIGTDVFK